MKKTAILIIFLLIILSPAALASQAYEQILSGRIQSEGIFDGKKGIIYADRAELEGPSLMIVSAEGSVLTVSVYGDSDGLQLTDTLRLETSGYRICRLINVKSAGKNYIMFSRMSENEFYTIQNDAFVRADVTDYFPSASIAISENGKITPSVNTAAVNTFLNRLKEETIRGYGFTNKVNLLSDEEKKSITATLSACADIMRFDIKNYDYDRLFKYILYTHDNFRVLTDIDPKSGQSSSVGYNNVSLVGSDFIDYVMENVFRITPEKPPVNNLLSRGFCYNDGYYLYSGGFDVYFATELHDLIGAYDLGGNTIYVVFSDIYREGNTETPEYSFAVLQKTGEGYSLLRLGMGESLPSAAKIRGYSPFSVYGGSVWSSRAASADSGNLRPVSAFLLPALLALMSVGAVALACSVVLFIKTR